MTLESNSTTKPYSPAMATGQDPFINATPEFLQRRADSWSRAPAIAYDPIEGTLYRETETAVEGM